MSALREVLAKFGISFDDKELRKGNAAITDGIDKVKAFAGAIGGALALGAIKDFIFHLVEEADALNDQAEALGLSTKELQEWSYAADLGGSNADALVAAFKRIGAGASAKGLQELGIKTTDAANEARIATDVFEDAADALAKIDNPAERSAKAAAIFGKQYAVLMPLLNQGREGIAKLRAEFGELGGGFDDDFIKNAAEVKDETDRLGYAWKSFKVTIVGFVLPSIRTLLTATTSLVKPVLNLLRHSEALKTGMIALALKGLVVLSGKIGPLGAAFRILGGHVLKTIAPLLILEDLLVFLAGGDSLIGRALDKAFGPGTADKVRDFVKDVKKEVVGFIDDLKNRPLKLLEDWELFTKTLSKDLHDLFGTEWGNVLDGAGAVFMYLIDLLSGGWDNFVAKWAALGDGMALTAKIIATEIKFFFLEMFASLSDKWDEVANKAKALVGIKPGRAGTAAEEVRAMANAERLQIATEGDALGARFAAGRGGTTVTNAPKTEINVNVAPGTPAQQAQNLARAAEAGAAKGVTKSLSGTMAPLVPGAG